MPRSTAIKVFWATILVGIVALLVTALTDDRRLAFSPGVQALQVAANMAPGERACQKSFVSEQAFDAFRFQVGTYRRPGPPLEVTLREVPSGAVAATGALPGGYPDVTVQTVRVRPVPAGKRLDLCFRNRGTGPLALYGAGPRLGRQGNVEVGGKKANLELTVDFLREPKSMFSLLPTVFRRAALFRPDWVGAWTFWVLLGVVTVFVPLLLARALSAGETQERETETAATERRYAER